MYQYFINCQDINTKLSGMFTQSEQKELQSFLLAQIVSDDFIKNGKEQTENLKELGYESPLNKQTVLFLSDLQF